MKLIAVVCFYGDSIIVKKGSLQKRVEYNLYVGKL